MTHNGQWVSQVISLYSESHPLRPYVINSLLWHDVGSVTWPLHSMTQHEQKVSWEIDSCLNSTPSDLFLKNKCVIWLHTHYGQWVSQEISFYSGSHPFRPCVWYKLSCLKMMQLSPDHHQVWPILNRKSLMKWTHVQIPPHQTCLLRIIVSSGYPPSMTHYEQ